MIVDTSVWSYALRKNASADDLQVEKLASAIRDGQPIALLGVILQEVLQGFRRPEQFAEVKKRLEAFPLIELEREDYVAAAELRNTCAAKGVSASAIDFQIAAACLRRDYLLLTSDRDFKRIADCCGLKLG